ncbi:hypothetical protein [Clostridium aminobutyricum]|uniref:Uncharacterized protein n=1 Tax=Clostridium aminobutyricum TaxID=33953 RepID=A0A939IHE4_CLOAM|nr:hypothetical protein [Clostridium aminobutyricum]MBN7771836.1 hypothetical protein [Clostridium aminobutyricum]
MRKQNLSTIKEDSKLVQGIKNLAVDYRPVDIKRLCKAITTEEQLADFEAFNKMLKNYYDQRLISREFIGYIDNIRAIMEMNIRLKAVGIVTYNHRLSTQALNELTETIHSDKDFEDFVQIWKDNCHCPGYLWILKLYKESKGIDTKNQKRTEELEKAMFGKNYDALLEWRKSKTICVEC